MYALVDCNSFFCSVERVFHPGLKKKPVCVLSNNDGCIVALTPEAKAVGLHRGDLIFKVDGIVKHYGVQVFSGNMYLYAAMSRRVTNILRKSIHHVENYSIDESFCDLRGYEQHFNIEDMMRDIANRILLYTDIPVSVGVAPSKTLAKMGSKFAKKYRGYRNVCMIDTDEKRRKALALFDLSDVWGIGRHTLEKLNYYGVQTPLDFAEKKESWVRSHLTLPGVQTWLELNGIPCIDTSEVKKKQTICTSRSFGEMISDFNSLKASVATFAASCANKLRGQESGCRSVTVFVGSNPFREDLPQYGNAATETMMVTTADTQEITNAAISCLKRIFVLGIMYKRSGVVVSDIAPMSPLQQDFFDPVKNRKERNHLMAVVDCINQKYGVGMIRLTASLPVRLNPQGEEADAIPDWMAKHEHRSPNYLTDINEILVV